MRAPVAGTSPRIEEVAAGEVLDRADAWFCARRKRFPDPCDIGSLRRQWNAEPARVQADLIGGPYRFSLLSRVRLDGGEDVDV